MPSKNSNWFWTIAILICAALVLAINRGFDYKRKQNLQRMYYAVRSNDLATIGFFLDSGGSPYTSLFDKSPETTLLSSAIRYGKTDVLKYIRERGYAIDVTNASSSTSLCQAAGSGQRAVVRLLLEEGADPNYYAVGPGKIEWSPVLAAASCRTDSEVVLDLLIRHGARVGITNTGASQPLARAFMVRSKLIIELLMMAGADPYAIDLEWNLPLLQSPDFLDSKEISSWFSNRFLNAKDAPQKR